MCVHVYVHTCVLVSNDFDQDSIILYATAFTWNRGLNMYNFSTIGRIKRFLIITNLHLKILFVWTREDEDYYFKRWWILPG